MLETMASCVECLWAVGCEREGHAVEMSWELIERMTEFKLIGNGGIGAALEVIEAAESSLGRHPVTAALLELVHILLGSRVHGEWRASENVEGLTWFKRCYTN